MFTLPALPEGWEDFKIVETVSGSFTGQVHVKDTSTWSEIDRLKLREITKLFLEEKTGLKIQYYNGDK